MNKKSIFLRTWHVCLKKIFDLKKLFVGTPLTNITDLLESTFKQCESFTWAGVCVVTT